MDWVERTYVEALNIIHHVNDRYAYEAVDGAARFRDHSHHVGCGITGLSIGPLTLSAIKYAKST